MKYAIMIILILMVAGYAFYHTVPVHAEQIGSHTRKNTKYQMIRTKHRVMRGFTNNGRILYQYVTDADVSDRDLGRIGEVRIKAGKDIERFANGNVSIGEKSRLRRINIGVDLKKAYRFNDHVKIGSIKADGSKPKLELIETNVSLRAPLRVH
ncbi:hypothetical protein DSCO28_54300 [Desulfosarcina ovata subsp. sediminis]|uniref:Uncharacterized protein n=1 Tax=Desulfosarcina ovata subsp. sediminis TaxID=885957 RepID=A0A5K7ZXF6_9BACT|nr:hypothetical protein [Desulfosarcina ovata]BBO84864.1 hypothetical protein DSCO28_54300 [Desulfosarcina ovata subsp. sediminis]